MGTLIQHHSIRATLSPNIPACASLQIRENVERRSFSSVKSLMLVGTALLVVMIVSRAVWMQNMWNGVEDGQVEFVGYGHEVDLSITCTYDTGAAPWTKTCSCSGIFHCGCVGEITECMKAGGCANICWQKEQGEAAELLV